MMKIFALLSMFGLVGVTFFAFNQEKELEAKKEELGAAIENLHQVKEENRRFKVVNAIYYGATTGLHGTKPEITNDVNKVVDFILASKNSPEEKFKECWDRKLKTTNWGSMGPYGLLDDCIDTIVDANTAIFIRDIDNKKGSANYACRAHANNSFEGARDCWADRNFRMINSANNTLFDFITTKAWVDNQKSIVRE